MKIDLGKEQKSGFFIKEKNLQIVFKISYRWQKKLRGKRFGFFRDFVAKKDAKQKPQETAIL